MNPSKKVIYYSVDNGGDGSAYPQFFEEEVCAELHQKLLLEGWGEPCTGSLTITGDNLNCKDAMSRAAYLKELKQELKDEKKYSGEGSDPERIPQLEAAIKQLDEQSS